MWHKSLAALLAAFFLAGCAPYTREELDRLLKEDPEFRLMIATRDRIHTQVRDIKKQMLDKKRVLDAQLQKLRQEYDTYAKTQNKGIENLESVLETYRSMMLQEIETASAQLAAKEKEREGYQKTLKDVKKVLSEAARVNLSQSEKQKWEDRILMLAEKMRPLREDIEELRTRIRLKKRKLGFLR